MVLSENFKDRLKKLAGVADSTLILEGDKRAVIMNSVKLPKEIADWAHNLSDKYSIWIADSFKKDFIDATNKDLEEKNLDSQKKNELINKILNVLSVPSLKSFKPENEYEMKVRDVILNRAENYTGTYQYILDWLKGRQTLAPETDQINLKTLTFDGAQQRSKTWHDELKKIQGGKIEDEDGEVIKTFPDGFYWIRLGRAKCEKEGTAMGHCGSGRGMLYSLRRDKYPYVTADINENTGQVMQMKGRANTKPKPDFHKYIIPFILGDNPNIQYFHSIYQPETDFNIADLNTEQVEDAVSKKPSLMFLANGGIKAVKKMSPRFIQELLLTKDEAIGSFVNGCDNGSIVLSDVLKTPEMVEWAIKNAKLLFSAENYGNISLSTEQIERIIQDRDFAGSFNIDKIELEPKALDYIVHNNPVLFELSKKTVFRLNDTQLDYLIKHAPLVFRGLMYSFAENSGSSKGLSALVVDYLGPKRLTELFKKEPSFFAFDDLSCFSNIFPSFLTGELLFDYVRTHSPSSDPLKFYNLKRLEEFERYSNDFTKIYLLQHYPDHFYKAGFVSKAQSPAVGKYIFDNHFDWLTKYQGGVGYNDRGFTFNMYDWKLNEGQIEKLIEYEINAEKSLLEYYNSEELAKFNFNQEQVNRLLDEDSNLRTDHLTIDVIKGLKVSTESALPLMGEILMIDTDNQRTIFNDIVTEYGNEAAHNLYLEHADQINALELDTKYHNLKRLTKFNTPFQEYFDKGVKFRFNDWSDDDLVEMFKEDNQEFVKNIVNWDLRFDPDYKFGDISFNDFDKINIARIKYLVTKAFPKEFKNTIKNLSDRELYDVIEDPDNLEGFNQSEHEYNEEIIEEIKTSVVRAFEDAQGSADEGEYHNLVSEALKEKFGTFEWVTQSKVPYTNRETKKTEYREAQLLEYTLTWEEFYDLVIAAEKYNQNDDDAPQYSVASNTGVQEAIRMGLKNKEEELEAEEPYYGVQGDVKDEDLNDCVSNQLFENDTLSPILDKAKIVTKRVKKK